MNYKGVYGTLHSDNMLTPSFPQNGNITGMYLQHIVGRPDVTKVFVTKVCLGLKFSIPLLDILGLSTNDLLLRKGIKHKM